MSAVAEQIDVDALIPDGFEPVEALRCWHFSNGKLFSLNGVEWKPLQALEAICPHGAGMRWAVVRHGLNRAQAAAVCARHNQAAQYSAGLAYPTAWAPAVPLTELPDGYGFKLETVTHAAPHETCSCGIYAATTTAQLPGHETGNVYGKVKLWGKVIPGERGVRAQYAYPSEFEVPAKLADHPGLKAFGVPITVTEPDAPKTAAQVFGFAAPPVKPRMHPLFKTAVALNLAAAAFDFSLAFHLWAL